MCEREAVVGTDITVNVETNGVGAATSTSALVLAALNTSVPAAALIDTAHTGGNDGTGVVDALAFTNLAGGVNASSPAAALIDTAHAGGNDGDGIIDALAFTNLTGGVAPTLNVKLQDSFDGVDWNDVAAAAFSQLAATGRQALSVTDPVATFLRAFWTIAGATPSFTFDVKLLVE